MAINGAKVNPPKQVKTQKGVCVYMRIMRAPDSLQRYIDNLRTGSGRLYAPVTSKKAPSGRFLLLVGKILNQHRKHGKRCLFRCCVSDCELPGHHVPVYALLLVPRHPHIVTGKLQILLGAVTQLLDIPEHLFPGFSLLVR